ncbi:MAG: GTPase, partial [Planctomycetota bacterium]
MLKVLIVGKSNVGKSTLFNTLIRRKLAIVDKSSGTTRDFVVGRAVYKNLNFDFIDSAGIGFLKEEVYQKAKERVLSILNDVDFILFVVDGKTQPTHEDFYIHTILSKIFEKVALVINKVDNEKILYNVFAYSKLKYDYTFIVSALLKKGIEEIYEFLYERFKDKEHLQEEENSNPIKAGIIGKRGVGKSSYINALLNSEVRLVSSKSPTTRDIGVLKYYIFNTDFAIYDTPGLFKKKSKETVPDIIAMNRVFN